MSQRDPTARFSDRVDNYVRARPHYPFGVLDAIEEEAGLTAPCDVADIGSGTGIFTRVLLERGHTVYAVEPNAPMRRAAEEALSGTPGFHSIDGTSEATSLADASVDLVTAAQAFHWFEMEPTRAEWKRILRPPAWVAVIWNDRRVEDGFGRAYEELLEEWGGAQYSEIGSLRGRENFGHFFSPSGFRERVVSHAQRLDLPALEARLLSSSYLPGTGDPRHLAMLEAAREMFEKYRSGGQVTMEYDARSYVGAI